MKYRLLIIVLFATLTIGITSQSGVALPPKKEAKKHKDDKDKKGDKPALTKKQKREQKKALKKKEKQEHKQAKLEKKKEKANSKKAAPTRAQKKQQRKELKHNQKAERKRLKQERKQKKHNRVNTLVVTTPQPVPATVIVKKKHEITYPHSQMKPRYRVDVLAPMYLDDLVKGGSVTYKDRMPEKALPGITFYEGVSIAADSLKRAGFNIDIYVHDVASASESTDMLLKKGMLDSADLIIGAVQAHDVPTLADYARKKHVNFISVLSASDAGVRENEYFTLIQPSLKSHCEWIDSDVARKFSGMKPVLFYRTTAEGDSIAYSYITKDSAGKKNFKPLLCNSIPHKYDMVHLFDTSKPNVIIVPILDFVYADSLLKELSHDFPGSHFEVYGMPSWHGIANLRNETAFPNLSVDVTTPFNINTSEGVAKYVSQTFKRDYGGKATEMVYRGYETMYWYANLLKNYGTIFNPKYADNSTAPFTKFDIKTKWDKNDHVLFNENTHLFVTRYEGGNPKTE